MKLTIVSILERGKAQDERLHLKATTDANLNFFLVFASSYSTPTSVSTVPKHVFWFPTKSVKAGDSIVLYTRAGSPSEKKNADGTTSYFFYWAKTAPLWTTTGDCAIVLEVNGWQTSPYQ